MPERPSAQYEITMRLECPHEPGWIAKIAGVIGEAGGAIHAVDLVNIHRGRSLRDYSVECASTEHASAIVEAIRKLGGVEVHSVSDNTFLMHLGGKLEITSKVPLKTRSDLSMAYTPGVARVCRAIAKDPAVPGGSRAAPDDAYAARRLRSAISMPIACATAGRCRCFW